jgi:hypothetical protein
MLALQISVGWEKKAFEVSYQDIVEGKERVKKQCIDVLKPLQIGARFVGRKPEDSASGECVVFTVEIDAGMVSSMMEDAPHVRVDAAKIENIVQDFVYGWRRGDRIMIAVMGDVQ